MATSSTSYSTFSRKSSKAQVPQKTDGSCQRRLERALVPAAFGIDAAGHFGALAGGGQTIAISAAGVDRPAPVANSGLFQRIYASGAVLSEVPLGARPNRSRFLVRNRLIAALTRAVVVVEAAMKSGARSTAAQASALGRIVAAVPGPITSAMSVGCHSLIREQQAVLVSSPAEVVELLAPVQTALAAQATFVARTLASDPAHMMLCLLYTSPSPRDRTRSRMPSSA